VIKLIVFRLISQVIFFFCLRRFARWLGYQEKIINTVLFLYIFLPDYLLSSSKIDFALRAVVTLTLYIFCVCGVARKIPKLQRGYVFAIALILTFCSCLFLGKNSPYSTSHAPYGRISYKFSPDFMNYKNVTPLLHLEINNDSVLTSESMHIFLGHPQVSAVVPRRVLESIWATMAVGSYEPAWIDSIIIGNILLLFLGLLSFSAFAFFEAKILPSQGLPFLVLLALNPRQLSFVSQTLGYSSSFFLTMLGCILLPFAWEAGLTTLLCGALAYDTWQLLAFLPFVYSLFSKQKRKETALIAGVVIFWHLISLKLLPSGGNLGWVNQLIENFKFFFIHDFSLKLFFTRSLWVVIAAAFALGPFTIVLMFMAYYFYNSYLSMSSQLIQKCRLRNWLLTLAILGLCLAPGILLAYSNAGWDGRIMALCPRYADSIYYGFALLASIMAKRSHELRLNRIIENLITAAGVCVFGIYVVYLAGVGLYPWYYIWQIPGFGKY
jgi:hypothetical protein